MICYFMTKSGIKEKIDISAGKADKTVQNGAYLGILR